MSEERELQTEVRPDLVHPSAWIASTATVLGEVHLAEESSVWFGAVLRGDCDALYVGKQTNVQDLCCLHADPGFPCRLGDRVTVGHGAIVHGATVENDCLIGIRAVVLNGARIGAESIVGAGALVPEGKEIPPRSLVVGMPARVVREVTDGDLQRIGRGTQHYVMAAKKFQQSTSNS